MNSKSYCTQLSAVFNNMADLSNYLSTCGVSWTVKVHITGGRFGKHVTFSLFVWNKFCLLLYCTIRIGLVDFLKIPIVNHY